MMTSEITHRLRIGLALVAGFLAGKALAMTFPHYASECFAGGFVFGFMSTRLLFAACDRWRTRAGRSGDPRIGRR